MQESLTDNLVPIRQILHAAKRGRVVWAELGFVELECFLIQWLVLIYAASELVAHRKVVPALNAIAGIPKVLKISACTNGWFGNLASTKSGASPLAALPQQESRTIQVVTIVLSSSGVFLT